MAARDIWAEMEPSQRWGNMVLSGLRMVKRRACWGLGPCDITSPLELCPDSERHVSGVRSGAAPPLRHHRGASRHLCVKGVKAASSPVTSSRLTLACITCLADCENALDGDFYAFISDFAISQIYTKWNIGCSPHILRDVLYRAAHMQDGHPSEEAPCLDITPTTTIPERPVAQVVAHGLVFLPAAWSHSQALQVSSSATQARISNIPEGVALHLEQGEAPTVC